MSPTTVLIAESNRIFLEALKVILSFAGFDVVANTSESSEVPTLARKYLPDLLIYDLGLAREGVAGLSELADLKKEIAGMKVLVIGCYEIEDAISENIIEMGLDGFWNKYAHSSGLKKTLAYLFP